MSEPYDLVAIGGGTGGLVSAAGAAYLGLKSAIVEKTALGGDCLWTGCVPSKALVASARAARGMGTADRFGLKPAEPEVDLGRVMGRVREARSVVAHHDDPQRFREMGVDVHFGSARFVDSKTLDVEGAGRIRSKRFIIATGARPWIPPIPGLAETAFWTHENVFDQDELPRRIVLLGGGPIGIEFAQIFCRLGSRVTVLEMADRILPKEDPDVADYLARLLAAEGVDIRTGAKADSVETTADGVQVLVSGQESVRADRILVATGRRPVTEGLGLDRAGVAVESGVKVDATLRTTAKGIWAVGDVTGGLQFTHVAEHMAKGALQNSLSPFPRRISYEAVPWVTYTDPEVAHVGLSEEEADRKGGATYRYDFDDLDRAIADEKTAGFVKISADRKGKILGATIVGHGAGELILPLVMALKHDIGLSQVAGTIFPYPTMAEGVKRTANEYMRGRLDTMGGRLLKKVIQWMK